MDRDRLQKRALYGLPRKRKFIDEGPVNVARNLSAEAPKVPSWVKFAYETCLNTEENCSSIAVSDRLALKKISVLLSEMERKKCSTQADDSQIQSGPLLLDMCDGSCDSDVLEAILRKEGISSTLLSLEQEEALRREKENRFRALHG
uniref:Uncharacterized protein n=1 Tax=Trichuris muris TaxID=70415 RepID=A0A5S6Q7V9_TRIMR